MDKDELKALVENTKALKNLDKVLKKRNAMDVIIILFFVFMVVGFIFFFTTLNYLIGGGLL